MDKFIEEYKKLQKEYYATRWPESKPIIAKMQELKEQAADAVGPITDEVRKQWFKNYGCMNGWSAETEFLAGVAWVLHGRDKKLHPELHKNTSHDKWRCYHVDSCSCGMADECDSGD